MNEYSKEEILSTIEKIIGVIDSNFKSYKKKLTYPQIFELVQNLDGLFEYLYNIDYVEAGKLIRKKYIPLLNLLLKIDENIKSRTKYIENLENAYRLAGRTDLECFIIYYEWHEKDKFYEPRYEILSGYCYYLNKMIFDPDFEGIIANLPSGWGKTYLTNLAAAFSYGVDDKGTILSLCSNEDVVNGGSRTVKEIMQNERFGDVFPHLRYSKDDKSYYIKDTESEWKLKNCRLTASYFARTTKSNVVGCRASKWVYIDDLYADYKEALNESDNVYYYNKFLTVWRKRFIQEAPVWKFIISGTMWSPKDFIVKIINWLEKRYKFIPHPKFKFVRVSQNGKFAIIQVPALDKKTGESNCPRLASTETLLNEKASMDGYIFECNFQQNPISPESMAFDWKNLKTYKVKPQNEYGATYAVIDGTRKSGKDFFSMPIFQPYLEEYFALIDCIYTQTATTKLTDDIINKIITNNIKVLVIETNVDGGLKDIILKELKAKGFDNGIQIIEKYSTEVKQTRIELERGNITDKIFYPSQEILSMNSDMGKFMNSFTMYNIEGKNEHDDACFEENTLISTQFGYKKIKDVKVGDKVITPFGLRKVINCGITGYKPIIDNLGLKATSNHKIYNKKINKFVPLDRLTMYGETDILSLKGMIKWKIKLLNLMGKYTKETQRADIILSTQLQMSKESIANNCIEQYGNITMAKSQKGIKFIIRTAMSIIMTFLTWFVYQLTNIYHIMQKKCGKILNIKKNKQILCEEIALYSKNAKNGIKVKKEKNGIDNMHRNQYLKISLEKKEFVNGVEKNILQKQLELNIAATNASKNLTIIQKLKYVRFAIKNFIHPVIELKLVQENVNQDCKAIPVYNITVENGGCYYANNILVSNCDSAAMFTSEIVSGKAKPQKAKPIKRPF